MFCVFLSSVNVSLVGLSWTSSRYGRKNSGTRCYIFRLRTLKAPPPWPHLPKKGNYRSIRTRPGSCRPPHMSPPPQQQQQQFYTPMMLRLGGVTEAKWDKGSQQKSEVRCLRHLTPTYFHLRYGYSPIKERKNGGKEMSLHRKRCEERGERCR